MGFRDARIKAGLSVITVAKEMSVSDVAVYLWETGQTVPRLPKLTKLAKLYGCSVDDLLKEETDA